MITEKIPAVDYGKAVSYRGNRRRIKEVMKRASDGKPVTVAFLGGSITQGCAATHPDKCYAHKVYEWFAESFPRAEVKYVNAGIGATDSQFGCARADSDLLIHDPDICFVEFAVNDEATEHYRETYEGLVRKILSSDPSRALMLIENVRYDDGGNAQLQHSKVARRYDVPSVSMRDVIYPELESGRLDNRVITQDDLHPNDIGHSLVASVVIHVLEEIRAGMNEAEEPEKEMPSPETPNAYEDSVRYRNDNSSGIVTSVKGFEKDSLPQEVITDVFRKGWTATDKGASITFKVYGSCIGVQYRKTIQKPAPAAKLILDGNTDAPFILDADFDEDWGDKLVLDTVLDHGDPGEHTVRIELSDTHEGDVLPFYLVSVITSGRD
ncbi:MAG: SGNH/GDSL hydrolase family protein [Lachnospiraceae bacterium]|nr:SGNH/GDSL hydrolase family protein [Lachnospiraceae bacterium]